MKIWILFLGLFLSFSACKDSSLSYEEQFKLDTEAIEKYLADNNLTAQKTASGLYYIITLQGQDGRPGPTSTVTVGYKGYLLDGTIFDETIGSNWAQFNVSGVVLGFGEAVQLLEKKGRGTFIMPSGLGYGSRASGSIPANSPLIFEIELVDFF